AWLRGYCHLLMALGEVFLAYDGRELFDHTAQLFFARPEIPFDFLKAPKRGGPDRFDIAQISDVIALIHLIRLKVAEPARMTTALEHLRAMVALSRASWKFYLAE